MKTQKRAQSGRLGLKRKMIEVTKVHDKITGNDKAHDILKTVVDDQAFLILSGGTSPDYRRMIVEPGDILPGAVCVADERFGMPYHDDSNELLLKNAGIIDFLHARDIKFYKILTGEDIEKTATFYNQVIGDLFSKFAKKVGIMGIDVNLHTAGIFPQSIATKSPNWVEGETIEDRFPKRITLTLKALGQFTTFIILAFGIEKEEAVKKLLDESENDMQLYPAIFYRKSPVKGFLITDINV